MNPSRLVNVFWVFHEIVAEGHHEDTSEQVCPKEDVLNKLELQVVQVVLVTAISPDVNHYLLVGKDSVPWPVLIPETLQSLCVCYEEKKDASRNLAAE